MQSSTSVQRTKLLCHRLKLDQVYLSMHFVIMVPDHVLDLVRDSLCGLLTHLLILGVGLD